MAQRDKRPSRAQQRAAQQAAAARVRVPAHADVCVIGGGAAGLVSAIAAAEHGAQTVVLERDAEVGRTILATGNGRCNFANEHLDPQRYHGAAFVSEATGSAWLADVLGFFSACGLAWRAEGEGRLYPLSGQAASVRNVLLARAQEAGVTLAPLREVSNVMQTHKDLRVRYRELFGGSHERTLDATSVVLATGGGLTPACASLGLTATEPMPVLCPLACTGPALPALDGRRVRARVTLLRDGQEQAREEGEVLFRPYGLSGIVTFNLSRLARPGDELALDLLPHLSLRAAQALATRTLDGLLDPVIAQALLDVARQGEQFALADDAFVRQRGQSPAGAQSAPLGTVPFGYPPPENVRAAEPRIHSCRAEGAAHISPAGSGLPNGDRPDSDGRLPNGDCPSLASRASQRGLSPLAGDGPLHAAALRLAKDLRYRVLRTHETERAQVTRGGLVTAQFDPATLQARAVPGLFACGEALDVDGPCGGYNLAWAWKSGLVAGAAAAAATAHSQPNDNGTRKDGARND